MYICDILSVVVVCLFTNVLALAIGGFFLYRYIENNHMETVNIIKNNFLQLGKKDDKSLLGQINIDDMNKVIQQIPSIINAIKTTTVVETEEEILLRTLDEIRTSETKNQ